MFNIEQMSTMERIYSDDQREALTSAYLDRGIRPQAKIVAMAKAGELTLRGDRLEPFTVPISTFRFMLVTERKRRAGKVRGETAKMPHEDAIEALRVRLVNVADSTLAAEERKGAAARDPERLRQIGRLVREVASMPGKGEGRATAPGQRGKDGQHIGGGRTTALGGSLIAAARSRPAPHRAPSQHADQDTESSEAAAEETQDTETQEPSNHGPVSPRAVRLGDEDAEAWAHTRTRELMPRP